MSHIEKKQFVIQEHTTPDGVHWDLMLQMEDCLWTWRLNTPPAKIKDEPIPAEHIHDHPLRFLTYEGPVQNNTGHVTIADNGTYSLDDISENALVICVQGALMEGVYTLSQKKESSLWRLCRTSE